MKSIIHKYKLALSVLLVSICQTGCNDVLNLDPMAQIADGNYWKTANDFKLFANQFYGWRRGFNQVVSDAPHSDYRSDIVSTSTANLWSTGNNTIPATDGNFSGTFSRVRLINTLLEKAESYPNKAEIAQFVAEAQFYRAYIYFDLLQLFGDAPILKNLPDVTDPILTADRSSRTEVTDFIIEDLQAAIAGLPLQSGISTAEDGRVSRGAAQAFLSRVALFEGTWQKFRGNTARATALLEIAASSAKAVINSNEYALFKPAILGDSAQKYLFILENTKSNPAGITKADNKEYIFTNRYDEVLAPIGINITHGLFANVLYVSSKFANLYLTQNGLPINHPGNTQFAGYATMASEYQNRDNRMRYTLMRPGGAYWRNTSPRVNWLGDAVDRASAAFTSYTPSTAGSGYNNQKFCAERAVPDRAEGFDFPIIRYAEVLLNYAEAIYEKDGNISDADLNSSLNLVRKRVNANMPALTNEFVSTNGLNMRTEIRRERTIELFNEGFRIDDLKRWKTAETEMPQDILGIKYTGTAYQTTTTGGWNALTRARNTDGLIIMETGRSWQEKHYLYPLPEDQLKLNRNLTQNPGW